MKNIRVKDKEAVLSDNEVLKEMDKVEKKIDGNGRALLRKRGTEPVIRIMIESESMEFCKEYAEQISQCISERGHSVE